MHPLRRTFAASVIFVAICFLASFAAVPVYATGAIGTMDINGYQTVSDLTNNGSGTGWTWTANTATLELTSAYTSGYINIICQPTDNIRLVYTGNVTIAGSSGIACSGNLDVSGSGGVLTLTGSSSGNGLWTSGALEISGGSVSISAGGDGIYAQKGVIVSGAANLTASSTGSYTIGNGINVSSGGVVISTTGTVIARGASAGFAVKTTENGTAGAGLLTVTGGTVTTGGVGENNGNISGNLAVSGSGAVVTVNGSITDNGNLTVSNGTVNITGTVSGTVNVTGGSVEVNGAAVTPATLIASGTDWTFFDNGTVTITSDAGMTEWEIWRGNNSAHRPNVTAAVIGNAVTTVPTNAFVSCTNLASVTFEATSSVASIGNLAFGHNTALQTIEIPASVTSIDTRAFVGAPLTDGFTVTAGSTKYSASTAGALLETAGSDVTLYLFPNGKTGSYTIESGITKIGDRAFVFTNLTSVTIPAGITDIGTTALQNSATLKTVTFEGITPPAGLNTSTLQPNDNLTYIFVPSGALSSYQAVLSGLSGVAAIIEKGPDNVTVSTGAELKEALQKPYPTTITLTADITLDESVTMNASHTLTVPTGTTLTLSGGNNIITVGSNTLSINGGGTVTVANNENGIRNGSGTGVLNLDNITVNLQPVQYYGIRVNTVNVNSGATVNLNSATGGSLIHLDGGQTLTVNSGGVVYIQHFHGTGINNSGGTMHINGGTVDVRAGLANNWGIANVNGGLLKYTSGTFTGDAGGAVYLSGSKVEGVNGKFNDRGTDFTVAGEVTVGTENAPASGNGLSRGLYFWNVSTNVFERLANPVEITSIVLNITAPVAGETFSTTPTIGGAGYNWSTINYTTTSDGAPFDWGSTFAANTDYTATVVLYSLPGYQFGTIPTANVTGTNGVVQSATINGGNLTVVVNYLAGVGTITGTMDIGGTTVSDLAQSAGGTGWMWTASSATLILDNAYAGAQIFINCQPTDNITLVYTGNIALAGSITCQGNLTIGGSGGVLTLTSGISGIALYVSGALQISGGSVSADGGGGGVYAQNGLTVSGAASLTANATGTFGNGIEVYDGNVVISTTGTVSAKGVDFAVDAKKGGVYAAGLLNISGGTVTLTNSYTPANLISGGLNHTGGTLNGHAAGAFPGGSVNIAGDLAGDYYAGNGKGASGSYTLGNYSSYAHVSGNALTIASGNFTGTPSFSGGYSYREGEHANGNRVTVNGGDFSGATASWIYGGYLDGYTGGGEANSNTVVVTNFSGTISAVTGGQGSDGGASGNSVTISGGGSVENVSGAGCGSGNATGNTVTLTGGRFTGGIYGASAMYDATGNTVTVETGATLDADVTLYGGSSSFGDAVTGNVLNLKKSGVTIRMLGNFAEYNFTLPASIAAGSTVITASDGYDGMSAIDVTGVTVGLAFDGAPSLAVGNKVTLIDGGTYGVTGAPTTTSLTASGYTFDIAVESNKLVATVTAAPVGTAPTITTTALPNGTIGAAYSQTLAATGTTPITWNIVSGTLPGGLTLTSSTGEISGTPTTAGTANFTVKATNGVSPDATKSLSITVNPATYGVSISSFSGGSISADKYSAAAGETVTLTVYPDNGYELYAITVTGNGGATVVQTQCIASLPETYTFTMPAGGVTVTATFRKTADLLAVEEAQRLIENAVFTLPQATANTQSAVRTWLAGVVNSLIWYTGVSVSEGSISVSGFTAAVAGTAARPSGTNGRFSLSVSLSKGGSYATALNSGTVTATPWTPPATYTVTIGTTVNGTVTANPSIAAAGTTVTLTVAPAAGYEPDAITVTRSDGSGDDDVETRCIASLQQTASTYTFTMPACDVTVRATFRKTQAQLDIEAVEAAKAAIEGGTYRVAQAAANDAAGVRTWLINTLNVLFGQSHSLHLRSAETPVVGDIAITAATPAIAGTETAPSGTDGVFSFTVSLAKGAGNATATVATGVIVATPHASTPVKRIELLSSGTLTVRILNTGNVATGELTLALTGANADVFTLPSETAGSLPVGGEADITLTPRADLPEGTYTAILTVSGEGLAPVPAEITYTVLPTGTADIPQAKGLKAWTQNGTLHVSGLTAGKPWSVYSLSGALIYRSVAGSDEANISLPVRGVYVVTSGGKSIKTAY